MILHQDCGGELKSIPRRQTHRELVCERCGGVVDLGYDTGGGMLSGAARRVGKAPTLSQLDRTSDA